MFVLDRFAGECSFCYTKAQEDRMTVCECGTEMCSAHTSRHAPEEHKRISIIVYGRVPDLEIEVDSTGTDIDTEHVRSVVRNTLLYPNMAKQQISMKSCVHGMINSITVKSQKCEKCEVDNNTWVCTACSAVLCGRKQYGIEGNGHAIQHYEQSEVEATKGTKEQGSTEDANSTKHSMDSVHSVFVKVQSLSKSDRTKCDVYCYICNEMVKKDGICAKISIETELDDAVATSQIEELLNTSTNTESTAMVANDEREANYDVVQKQGGIKNMGNTCYMSAVLQIIAYIVKDETERMHGVYSAHSKRDNTEKDADSACSHESPVSCFACQLRKVLERLAYAHNTGVDMPSITIDALYMTIEQMYPKYVLGEQQDTAELYEDIMNTINAYDEMGHTTMLAAPFKTVLVTRMQCARCNAKTEQEETQYVVYLGTEQSIYDVFGSEEIAAKCECGAETKTKTVYVRDAPDVLVVGIKKMQDNDSSEQKKEVMEEVCIETHTTEDKEGTQAKYTLCAAAIHEGTLSAGHYMAQIRTCTTSKSWNVYDDEKIGTGLFMPAKAVLLFYRRERA